MQEHGAWLLSRWYHGSGRAQLLGLSRQGLHSARRVLGDGVWLLSRRYHPSAGPVQLRMSRLHLRSERFCLFVFFCLLPCSQENVPNSTADQSHQFKSKCLIVVFNCNLMRENDGPLFLQDTLFGCCPDGQTPAAGPENDGCPIVFGCESSAYGCCEDGVTFANGLNGEGCQEHPPRCARMPFGCCLDGEKAAKGNATKLQVVQLKKKDKTTTSEPKLFSTQLMQLSCKG